MRCSFCKEVFIGEFNICEPCHKAILKVTSKSNEVVKFPEVFAVEKTMKVRKPSKELKYP